MRRYKFVAKKNRAQAMVEFAIALPILLLLLYGILEAGRLLFIYSSIVTASRQAVRYGSATGMGLDYSVDGGPNNSTYERYRDCYGIRRAAQRADYLNAFEDSDIRIYYDFGPTDPPSDTGVGEQEICTGGANNWGDWDPTNETRLVVKIDGDFLPIVPRIVPFMRRSADDSPPDPIEGDSARTILVSVSIVVTAPPSTWIPIPTFTATATDTQPATDTPSPTATDTPGPTDTLEPTRTRRNDPTATETGTATATGSPTLSPTASATGTATSTGTVTSEPTTIPTDVPVGQCFALTSPGVFNKSGNTMSITITNPNAFPVSIADVFVHWNGTSGHSSTGQGDDTLDLRSASLGSTVFWSGNIDGISSVTIDPSPAPAIPAFATNLALNFNFHQSYDNWDNQNRERIIIFFNPIPGCTTLNPVDVTR